MTTLINKGFNETLKNLFRDLNVKIYLHPENIEKDFNGDIEYFYTFFKEQVEFWTECNNSAYNHLFQIYNFFNSIIGQLDKAFNCQENNINQAQIEIRGAVSSAVSRNSYTIYSTTEIAQFIKAQYKIHPAQALAAFEYLINHQVNNINSRPMINGIINSFIWEDKNKVLQPDVSSRINAIEELKHTFSKDRDELYGDFKTKHQEITEAFNSFKDGTQKWVDEFKTTASEYFEKGKDDIQQFVVDKEKKLKELENLYKEKLMLEAPAEHWNNLYNYYIGRGKLWLSLSMGLSALFAGVLLYILISKPTTLFQEGPLNFNSLRATIIFVLITSILIYIVRLLVMLSTSAYHLARDAKERYQLTYVYLALIKEKAVTEAERSIILQSLFSRADTGLLKGDSSPTLPDGTISQLMKNIGATKSG
jgi:hypothetical protein